LKNTIARRVGIPNSEPSWGWSCGFHPGSHPGEYLSGTAADFEAARIEFETAWRIFSAERPEADYQEWRHQRDFTAEKYAEWDRGERITQNSDSVMRCICGVRFDSRRPAESYDHRAHIYAARAKGQTW
jgi:hypothetical protein